MALREFYRWSSKASSNAMDTLLDNPIIWIVLAIGLGLLPRIIGMVLMLIAGVITLVVGIIMFIARLAGKDS